MHVFSRTSECVEKHQIDVDQTVVFSSLDHTSFSVKHALLFHARMFSLHRHQSCPYSSDLLGSELSLPSSPVSSTKVRRRRRDISRKRASSVSPAKSTAGRRRRQAQADRKASRTQTLDQRSRGGTLFSFSLPSHLAAGPRRLPELP